MSSFFKIAIVFMALMVTIQSRTNGQKYDCYFKPPIIKIDFGSGNIPDVNLFTLSKYRRVNTICPDDGYYSFVTSTHDCFNGNWITMNEDHTGNINGNMMLVNASESGGVFFNTIISGLSANTTYQLALWLTNVCKVRTQCPPLPPNITITLISNDNIKIGIFRTGLIQENDVAHWKKFTGLFVTPANVTSLKLVMEDTPGGCGNDFAMDDIAISECVIPKPVIQKVPPVVLPKIKQAPPLIKPAPEQKAKTAEVKKAVVKPKPPSNDTVVIAKPIEQKPAPVVAVIMARPAIEVPKAILTRANPIVKEIETEAGEINVELYDNGEIDGDTVSVYHNNQLIVSRAGLSEKPVSFTIKIDALQSHHELVMVANNLGSIPPNTSMMIITTKNKRYEIFISSSDQKNAKVIIDLKQ